MKRRSFIAALLALFTGPTIPSIKAESKILFSDNFGDDLPLSHYLGKAESDWVEGPWERIDVADIPEEWLPFQSEDTIYRRVPVTFSPVTGEWEEMVVKEER